MGQYNHEKANTAWLLFQYTLLPRGDDDEDEVLGIFTTSEKAKAFVANICGNAEWIWNDDPDSDTGDESCFWELELSDSILFIQEFQIDPSPLGLKLILK